MAGLVIKPRARILHGHDWVYSSEILKAFGDPKDGDVVSLKDGRDRLLGSAIFNSHSQIVARRFSRQRQDLDPGFFKRRIQQAWNYRQKHKINPNACRVVWSESDGLPGVIIDRYENHFVLQTLTLAMDQRQELIAAALRDIFEVESIIARNDAPIRKAEGMELEVKTLHGTPPEKLPIEILGLMFELDLVQGQKTGFYLDQIDNYFEVAQLAKEKRVLDCFANQGAFALTAAKEGAKSVDAVEISSDCVKLIEKNAKRNGLAVNCIEANVFDFLKDAERRGEIYDLIILDPPSFTKSKGKLHDAMRGYKEIHLRALKLLSPEGLLATFCCSHHVSDELFKQAITEAVVDAKKTVRQLKRYGQGADHPILPTQPETEYLKGYLFELAPGR